MNPEDLLPNDSEELLPNDADYVEPTPVRMDEDSLEEVERMSTLGGMALAYHTNQELDKSIARAHDLITSNNEAKLRQIHEYNQKAEIQSHPLPSIEDFRLFVPQEGSPYEELLKIYKDNNEEVPTQSIEESAVDYLSAANPNPSNEQDLLDKYATRYQRIRSAMKGAIKKQEDSSTYSTIKDFLATFLPSGGTNISLKVFQLLGRERLKDTPTNPELAAKLLLEDLISVEDDEEFEQKLGAFTKALGGLTGTNDFVRALNAEGMLNILDGVHKGSFNTAVALDVGLGGLDHPSLLAMGKLIKTRFFKPTKAMIAVNPDVGTKVAAATIDKAITKTEQEVVTSGLATSTSTKIVEEAVEAATPSSLKLGELPGDLPGDVQAALEVNDNIIKEANARVRLHEAETVLVTEAEKQAAFDKITKELKDKKTFGFMVKEVERQTIDGKDVYRVILGSSDNAGGYKTVGAAKSVAKKKGLEDYLIEKRDGLYYLVKQATMVDETNFIQLIKPEEIKNVYQKVARYLNPSNFIPESIRRDIMESSGKQAILNKMHRLLKLAERDASVMERDAVARVLHIGADHVWKGADGERIVGKWFGKDELNEIFLKSEGRLPSEKEQILYYTYKQANDTHYSLLNSSIYTPLKVTGHEQVVIPSLNFNGAGRRIGKIENFGNLRIYDVTSNRYYKKGELTAEEFKKRVDAGDAVVSLLEYVDIPDSPGPVNLIIGKVSDIRFSQLNPIQLSYRNGVVHRDYKASFYIKQANEGTFADDGSRWVRNPFVYSGHESKVEGEELVRNLEEARLKVLKYKDALIEKTQKVNPNTLKTLEEDVTNSLQKAGITGLEEWNKMIDDGILTEKSEFKLVLDKEIPETKAGRKAPSSHTLISEEIKNDATAQWLAARRKRGFAAGRGEPILTNGYGTPVRTLNPYAVQDKAMRIAIRAATYAPTRIRLMKQWVDLVNDMEGVRFTVDNPVDTYSTGYLFNNANFETTNPEIANKLNLLRDYIKKRLNIPFEEDITDSAYRLKVSNFVDKITNGRLPTSTMFRYTNTTKAINALTSLMYDFSLGFFQPGQYLFQQTTALGNVFIHGSTKPLQSAYVMRMAMARGYHTKEIGKLGTYITGMDDKTFVTMMDDLDQSGFIQEVTDAHIWNIHHNQGGFNLIGDNEPRSLLSTVAEKALNFQSDARRKMRFFVNEGETMNRLSAWNAAYKEAIERGLKPGTREMRREVMDRAHALTGDMGEHAKHALNEGVAKLFYQFKGYSFNIMQNIFGQIPGLTAYSRLSRKEAGALAASQLTLYGARGVGFGATMWGAIEAYEKMSGKELDETEKKLLINGLFDGIIYGISGGNMDTDMASRASLLKGMMDYFREAYIDGQLGFVPGPVGNYLIGSRKTISNFATFMSISNDPNLTSEEAFDILKEGIKLTAEDFLKKSATGKQAADTLAVLQTGLILASDGAPERYVGKAQLIAELLGFKSGEKALHQMMMDRRVAEKDEVETLIKLPTMLANRAVNTKDVEERERLYVMSGLIMSALHKAHPHLSAKFNEEYLKRTRFETHMEQDSEVDFWRGLTSLQKSIFVRAQKGMEVRKEAEGSQQQQQGIGE